MQKEYQKPFLVVIQLDYDVITASTPNFTDNEGNDNVQFSWQGIFN